MRTLTIEALTPDSARALHDALSKFHAELRVTDDGTSYVDVAVGPKRLRDRASTRRDSGLRDRAIERSTGPARIAFNGRRYTLHAVPPAPPDA